MMEILSVIVLAFIWSTTVAEGQVYPTDFSIRFSDAVNGSSVLEECTSDNVSVCLASSVVFDGVIPTLTGLDGDMWASQLLTSNVEALLFIEVSFSEATNYEGLTRVEVALFNCPEWGIEVRRIDLVSIRSERVAGSINVTVSSCDALVSVCMDVSIGSEETDLQLDLFVPRSGWVHVAEVEFYGDGNCSTIVTTAASSTTEATTTDEITTTDSTECQSCTTSIIAAAVVTFIICLLVTCCCCLVVLCLYLCCSRSRRQKRKKRGEDL